MSTFERTVVRLTVLFKLFSINDILLENVGVGEEMGPDGHAQIKLTHLPAMSE